jgi:hypothetical protein
MKADERKALVTNDLAKGLEDVIEGVKHPPRTAMYWVGGVVAVVLAVVLFRYFLWSSEVVSSGRWLTLDEVTFPEQATLVESKLAGTPQGRMLQFKEARMKLSEGLRRLGVNRESAIESIREATKLYEDLLKSAGRVPLLHQEALAGAARGREALGDLDDAKKWYESLARDYRSTPLGEDAAKQVKRLDENKGQLRELARELGPEAGGRPN